MILDLLKRYKLLIIFAAVTSTLSALAGLGLMAVIKNEAAAETANDARVIIFLAGVSGFFVTGMLSQQLLTVLSARLIRRLRTMMVRRVLGTDYERLEALGGHRIYATITNDVSSVSGAFQVLPLYAFNLTTAILCLAYLAYLSWEHFVVLMGVLFVSLVIARAIYLGAMFYLRRLREQYDSLFGTIRELVGGGKELALNPNRKVFFFNSVYRPIEQQLYDTRVKAELRQNLSYNLGNASIFIAIGAIVFAANRYVPMDAGTLIGYILVITYLIGPVRYLFNSFDPLSRGYIAHKKIESLELAPVTPAMQATPELKSDVASSENWSRLRLKDVKFSYGNDTSESSFSIGPITMTINKGQCIFFTGGNGSGKSTFAKVLTGLYRFDSGTIELDDTELDEDNLEWYRSHFSTIFSDFYLFDEVLDKRGWLACDEKVARHLDKLMLSEKVTVTEGILSTTQLSQGQRKRLALLLAYMEDAPIYVFDEWAADQDPYFRKYFYTQLLPELKEDGKTVIVISHDDRYFHLGDRLFCFEYGDVRELSQEERELGFNLSPAAV